MLTETLSYGTGTRGSHSILLHGRRLRMRASAPLRHYFVDSTSLAFANLRSYPPVQSAGESQQSLIIENYLGSALADFLVLVSDPRKEIRMTISPETRAAAMDPWEHKNQRRIRLLDKKFSVGLDVREEVELAKLKREIYDHVQAIDPRPADDPSEIDARFDRMKKRILAKRGKTS
jgi:hypothetical protein